MSSNNKCANCVKRQQIVSEEPKQKFKRLLGGELIDWKEHALRLTDLHVKAELREKEFCPDSMYWYAETERLYKEAGYTEEQQDFLHEAYMKWHDEKEDEENPF